MGEFPKEVLNDYLKDRSMERLDQWEIEKSLRETIETLEKREWEFKSDLRFDQENFQKFLREELPESLKEILRNAEKTERSKKIDSVIRRAVAASSVKSKVSRKRIGDFIHQIIDMARRQIESQGPLREQMLMAGLSEKLDGAKGEAENTLKDSVGPVAAKANPSDAFHKRLIKICETQIKVSENSTRDLGEIDPKLYPGIRDENGRLFLPDKDYPALFWALDKRQRRDETFLLIGEGGIGKTAALCGTCRCLLSQRKAAVYVPLRSLRQYHSIENYIIEKVLGKNKDFLNFWNDILNEECPEIDRLYLFVDGFNELPEELLGTVIEELREYAGNPSACLIISSRRPLEARRFSLSAVSRFTVERLSWKSVEEYLKAQGIAVPRKAAMSEVLGIPLMLCMYTAVKKQENLGITKEGSLDWKKDMSNSNHILWNYIQCQIYQAADPQGIEKGAVAESFCKLAAAAEYLAPFLASKMNKAGVYESSGSELEEWITEGLERLKEDINGGMGLRGKKSEIYYRFSRIGTQWGRADDWSFLEKNEMFYSLTDKLNLLERDGNIFSFAHQDFQDVLHLIYIENSIKYPESHFFSGAFTDFQMPYDVLTLMGRTFSENQTKKLRKMAVSKECGGEYGVYNLIELEKRIHNNDLSSFDFSGLDLKGVNLSGTTLSGSSGGAIFRGADIGFDTFQSPGHSAPVTGVSWSPEGGKFASSSYDNEVRIWNAETGEAMGSLRGHTHYVRCVSWSPKDSCIASGGDDRTVRIWDIAQNGEAPGSIRLTLTEHRGWVYCLQWSPDGEWIVSGDSEKEIILWDLRKQVSYQRFLGHVGKVRCLSWNPVEEGCFASGGDDAWIGIWDRKKGVQRWLKDLPGPIKGMTWSEDGKILAASVGGVVYCWEKESLIRGQGTVQTEPVCILKNGNSKSGSLEWMDGLLGAVGQKTIWLWNMEAVLKEKCQEPFVWKEGSRFCLAALEGHGGNVTALSWSIHEKRLLSCSDDSSLRMWKTRTPSWQVGWGCAKVFAGCPAPARCAAWSPDSKEIAAGYDDTMIRIWNVQKRMCRKVLKGHSMRVKCTAWSLDGRKIASGSNDGTVILWNMEAGKEGEIRAVLKEHQGPVNAVLWLDNSRIASASDDGTICIWNWEKGEKKRLQGHKDSVYSISLSPDKTFLVSGADDRTIRFWNLESMDEDRKRRIPKTIEEGHKERIRCVEWLPEKGMIVSGCNDKTVRRWNADTGNPWKTGPVLEKHKDFVYCLTSSPDGRYFASGSTDNTLWIWESETGEPLWHLTEHTMFVWDVRWSLDGAFLSSASSDGTIGIWDVKGLMRDGREGKVIFLGKLSAIPGTDIVGCDFSQGNFESEELQKWIRMNGGKVSSEEL